MNRYHLLLPAVIAVLGGCCSELHYQEQAVESARKFIYENARELTPEQYAFVKFTPPVLFSGDILHRNDSLDTEGAVGGSARVQVCIAWRIPEQEKDYLVFGVSDGGMNNWTPARLIRRRITLVDKNAVAALGAARDYAVTSLYDFVSPAELNFIRFSHPELVLSSFDIGTQPKEKAAVADSAAQKSEQNEKKTTAEEKEESLPRPWKMHKVPVAGEDENIQLSLVWKLASGRYAVFCGVGQPDMKGWKIAMAGIFGEDEVKKARFKVVKTSAQYVFILEKNKKNADGNKMPAAAGKIEKKAGDDAETTKTAKGNK